MSARFQKRCACGRCFTLAEFLALKPPAGGGETEGNFGGRAFWRDCTCRSTLAVEVLPNGRVITDAEQLAGEIAEVA